MDEKELKRKLKQADDHLNASMNLTGAARSHMDLANYHMKEASIANSKSFRERNLAKIILKELEEFQKELS